MSNSDLKCSKSVLSYEKLFLPFSLGNFKRFCNNSLFLIAFATHFYKTQIAKNLFRVKAHNIIYKKFFNIVINISY